MILCLQFNGSSAGNAGIKAIKVFSVLLHVKWPSRPAGSHYAWRVIKTSRQLEYLRPLEGGTTKGRRAALPLINRQNSNVSIECHPQRDALHQCHSLQAIAETERHREDGTLFHPLQRSVPLIITAAFFFSPLFEDAHREKEIRSIVAF